jgi:glucose-1-phosphate adenylyltransferase
MQCIDPIAIILGGGEGKRLYPLTKYRAKPAVPIAGKFRLVDIPISNCLHSNINQIFVLTQYNSTSLHRHISQTYRFDVFSKGYVQILAAQQTQESTGWYQGTADAVRHNLKRFEETPCDYVLILAGDHLYRMNYERLIQEHIEKGANVTVAVLPIERDQVKEFGILKTEPDGQITEFVEKPQEENDIRSLEMDKITLEQHGISTERRSHVASMGIYVFDKSLLLDCLRKNETAVDFGKDIIPATIKEKKVYAHFFNDYWRDVGTIKSFYQANLELTKTVPEFNFYDADAPVYTRARFLPGSKINSCYVQSSILCEGSILTECQIRNSIIGLRSIVRSGADIHDSVIMGADLYETIRDECTVNYKGLPSLGIGRDSTIRNAIVDKNARIGCNVRIINQRGLEHYDDENYSIREGIVVVHKNAVITDNTII